MIYAYCAICTESFKKTDILSSLKCGHVYHNHCLLKWLKTKSNCPQCRSVDVGSYIEKLYFNEVDVMDTSVASNMNEDKVDIMELKIQINQLREEFKNSCKERDKWKKKANHFNAENKKLNEQLKETKFECSTMQESHQYSLFKLEEDKQKLEKKILKYKTLQKIISASDGSIKEEMAKYAEDDHESRCIEETLATALVLLRNKFKETVKENEAVKLSLSRCEAKIRQLTAAAKCESEGIGEFGEEDLDESSGSVRPVDDRTFMTPLAKKKVKRNLSIPQMLLLSSPDTPTSEVRRKRAADAQVTNVFQRDSPMINRKVNAINLSKLTCVKKPNLDGNYCTENNKSSGIFKKHFF